MLQSFDVPAKGAQITAQGNYFRLEAVNAAGADESVRVRADGQDLGFYLPGDSITLPVSAVRWEVVPITQTATAEVRIGVAGVQSSRMFGVVSVVDSAFNRVIAEQAYACRISLPAVAAQWGVASIRNPAGSGRRVSITKLAIGTNTPGIASLNTWTGDVSGGIVQTIVNKRRGGAANAVSIIAMGSVAAQAGSPILSGFFSSQLSSMILAEPIVLEPGQSVALQADTQNMQILGGIEFTELPL